MNTELPNIKSILLVDDERDIRDVLQISLTDMGYTVHPAENGEEALRIYDATRPQIVMTDIKMPGIDGIELLKRVKYANPDTEVIMITGHGDMALAIESLKNEATDFITKPINVDALEIALQRVHEKIIMKRQLKEYTANLERLVHEKSQLQDHLSSLGMLIGSISHGIKGLLTGLDGGLYILDSGLAKTNDKRITEVTEGLNIVKDMVKRIRKLVLDILFYAKERELQRESIEVLSFAADVARALEPKIKQHRIEFSCNFASALGRFEIDFDWMHAAMINILENAIDACTRDTTPKAHQIVFAVDARDDCVQFKVTDNGIGMDSDTMEKIFTLFFSSKGHKGTGFGLFITNHIIKQHGGSIKVKSKPNQGAQFIINIPKQFRQPLAGLKGKL